MMRSAHRLRWQSAALHPLSLALLVLLYSAFSKSFSVNPTLKGFRGNSCFVPGWRKITLTSPDGGDDGECARPCEIRGFRAQVSVDRRESLASATMAILALAGMPRIALADEGALSVEPAPPLPDVQVVPSGDAKQLFNEGRALEMQGNIAAANRLYTKVTKMAPRFIYGWSNLGNTQVAFGALQPAEESYTKAIDLCNENRQQQQEKFGVRRCDDLYVLLLNRGSLRLNNKMPKEALQDLSRADSLRGKPDAIVLQNLARARELNGQYAAADRDYNVAISMTSNEVAPFWLRSALVKFQLGDAIGALDLARRVENRFPEAPEVRAALATLLAAKGDQIGAQRKFLEIPDKARLKFVDQSYLTGIISWPPAMIENLAKLTKAVGDG